MQADRAKFVPWLGTIVPPPLQTSRSFSFIPVRQKLFIAVGAVELW